METRMAQSVDIKGIRDGLLIRISPDLDLDWQQDLQAELSEKQAFLSGSRVALAVGQRPLRREQLAGLIDFFEHHNLELWAVLAEGEETRDAARHLGLATRLPGSHTDLNGNVLPYDAPATAVEEANEAAPGPLLLKETVRSGRSIFHDGDIVIVGDVNPGAEVVAAGDVIVWGRLRGLVHAGALGDETAVICALELTPTQLRIADQIAIAPDQRPGTAVPERAAIRSGQIVAQPWQSKP